METFRTIALAALVAWFLVVTIVNWKNSSTGRHYKTNSDYREADRRTPITTPGPIPARNRVPTDTDAAEP